MTKIRLKLLADQVATFLLTVILISGAHAEKREHPAAFWQEQMSQGTMYRPEILQHGERIVRKGAREVYKATREVYRGVAGAIEGGAGVVASAARYIGSNPTGMSHNWCAVFANQVLRQNGYATSGSAMSNSFFRYGPHLPGPTPGAIAILPGHVGFVESVRPDGSVVLVSGNNRHCRGRGSCTARTTYSRRAFVAFVMPQRVRSATNMVDQQ